jgi:hypothetical protein
VLCSCSAGRSGRDMWRRSRRRLRCTVTVPGDAQAPYPRSPMLAATLPCACCGGRLASSTRLAPLTPPRPPARPPRTPKYRQPSPRTQPPRPTRRPRQWSSPLPAPQAQRRLRSPLGSLCTIRRMRCNVCVHRGTVPRPCARTASVSVRRTVVEHDYAHSGPPRRPHASARGERKLSALARGPGAVWERFGFDTLHTRACQRTCHDLPIRRCCWPAAH